MKIFSCDCSENSSLFFESVICTICSRLVGYCPDVGAVLAFNATDKSDLWSSNVVPGFYRQCQNYVDHQVCNWMIPAEDGNPLCLACRLNDVIPDLSQPQNIEYWQKLEIAKRHALYSVLTLDLPLVSKHDDPQSGLLFRFLADREPASEFTQPLEGSAPIFTGHDSGEITINLAEADEIARTRTRVKLGEGYRTLLGHFRHEIGHYYWSRLVEPQPELLENFRTLFGDERQDYAAARTRHYSEGPTPNWSDNFISAYASMHPWEDWAECWAHYMHMLDTLETAASYQLQLQGLATPAVALADALSQEHAIDALLQDWMRLSVAMNALSRSMGKSDPYPFVLTPPVQEKLRWVHHVVLSASG